MGRGEAWSQARRPTWGEGRPSHRQGDPRGERGSLVTGKETHVGRGEAWSQARRQKTDTGLLSLITDWSMMMSPIPRVECKGSTEIFPYLF